jgi:hypothetical protein
MNPKVGSLRLIVASVKAVKDLQLMAVNGKEPEYKKLTVPPRPEAKLTENKPKNGNFLSFFRVFRLMAEVVKFVNFITIDGR